MRDPLVAPVCLAVALVAWFTPHRLWEGKALALGVAPVPAMLMGIITGCAGGIIRDVIAGRPSILMRPEL